MPVDPAKAKAKVEEAPISIASPAKGDSF